MTRYYNGGKDYAYARCPGCNKLWYPREIRWNNGVKQCPECRDPSLIVPVPTDRPEPIITGPDPIRILEAQQAAERLRQHIRKNTLMFFLHPRGVTDERLYTIHNVDGENITQYVYDALVSRMIIDLVDGKISGHCSNVNIINWIKYILDIPKEQPFSCHLTDVRTKVESLRII